MAATAVSTMIRQAFARLASTARAPSFAPLQHRVASLLGGVRTKFSVDIGGRTSPDFARHRRPPAAGVDGGG